MNLLDYADYEAMSRAAARHLARDLAAKPSSILCLATGATPTRTYQLLAKQLAARPAIHRKLRILKLDEWGSLEGHDPASCEQYLRKSLVTPLKLGRRFVGFRCVPADPETEWERIRAWLRQHGPIDLCVLGLGLNGHLGFNEPASYLQPHAHIAQLSPTSLQHSMVKGNRVQPRYGLTLGMADLLEARRVMLLVSGEAKREPLAQFLAGGISTDFPASFLWMHPALTIFCDRKAYC